MIFYPNTPIGVVRRSSYIGLNEGTAVTHMDDTVIVPARPAQANEDWGLDRALTDNRWEAILMARDKQDHITYLAVYQTAASAITHIARVDKDKIEPWQDSRDPRKVVLHFDGPLRPLAHPIRIAGGPGSGVQGREYTSLYDLLIARDIGDLRRTDRE